MYILSVSPAIAGRVSRLRPIAESAGSPMSIASGDRALIDASSRVKANEAGSIRMIYQLRMRIVAASIFLW